MPSKGSHTPGTDAGRRSDHRRELGLGGKAAVDDLRVGARVEDAPHTGDDVLGPRGRPGRNRDVERVVGPADFDPLVGIEPAPVAASVHRFHAGNCAPRKEREQPACIEWQAQRQMALDGAWLP